MECPMIVLTFMTLYLSYVFGDEVPPADPNLVIETRARLLIEKKLLNKHLVESMDTVVQYNLFNVGDVPAVEVLLTDHGFPKEDFEIVSGLHAFQLERIAPKANNSLTIVVRPMKFGYVNFTSAEVRYRDSEDQVVGKTRVTLSTEPGQKYITALKEFDRQFSAHFLDWFVFSGMALFCLGAPFLSWHTSRAKYENLAKSKKD